MVDITFKNVGQGDSIIIEWEESGKNKLGIIDCNLISPHVNPVLEHIIKKKTKEIEFLLLSHPHKDHYSGFFGLIDFCRKNQIKINRFIHTAAVSIEYLMAASRSITETRELIKLYKLVMEMRDNDELFINTIDDNPDLIKNLSNGYRLAFLAPSSLELDNYIRGVNFPFDEEESTSNPNANWLCSIIKIFNDETSVLLTSDVESQVLNRLNKKNGRLRSQKSLLVQVPHHGSKNNLSKRFWSALKKHSNTYSVISVGKNNYKHPSPEVIDFFNNHPNYSLERTDEQIPTSTKAKKNSDLLNVISKPIDPERASNVTQAASSKDLSFRVFDNNCIRI